MRSHELLQKWQDHIPEQQRPAFLNDILAVAHDYWLQGVAESHIEAGMEESVESDATGTP